MRLICFAVALLLLPAILHCQEVKNTSYTTSYGERVLRIEFVVPLDNKDAWNLFTTETGLKKWLAPLVSIDFRVGGYRLSNYDKTRSLSDSGTIRSKIVNYLEGTMITYKVNLNETFPPKVRTEDQNLQEIEEFVPAGEGKTKIISSMIGWGTGPEWDRTYNFFARGNEWTANKVISLFK